MTEQGPVSVNVRTIAATLDVSADLLRPPTMTMTELDTGLEVAATIDEVTFDDLGVFCGRRSRFIRWDPPPTRELTPDEERRKAQAQLLRDLADELWPEERDDWDD